MKTTIFTHFWNEEDFLPYWLKHHLELFDHGVLINYRSTDKSVEIIRELAPHWEIHNTVNKDFNPLVCDTEISNHEARHPDWKIALTVTEFLFSKNLKEFLTNFQQDFPHLGRVRTQGIIMVDSQEERYRALTDKPLLLQRNHGYIEALHSNPISAVLLCSRSRLLHKKHRVAYTMGRHILVDYGRMSDINTKYGTSLGQHLSLTGVHPDLYLCWFGKFCPFVITEQRYEKMNLKRTTRVLVSDKDLVEQRPRMIDLRALPKYKEIYDSITMKHSGSLD